MSSSTFRTWYLQGELDSFLIEISSLILPTKDDKGEGFLVDKILDKTGMKGTGMPPHVLKPYSTLYIWSQ